jgi:hypothetical protein
MVSSLPLKSLRIRATRRILDDSHAYDAAADLAEAT